MNKRILAVVLFATVIVAGISVISTKPVHAMCAMPPTEQQVLDKGGIIFIGTPTASVVVDKTAYSQDILHVTFNVARYWSNAQVNAAVNITEEVPSDTPIEGSPGMREEDGSYARFVPGKTYVISASKNGQEFDAAIAPCEYSSHILAISDDADQIVQQMQKEGLGAGTVIGVTGSTTPRCINVNRNLGVGASGTDVSALQRFLLDLGLWTYASPTGYFGSLTKGAVTQFQQLHSLPATGWVGPLTRAALTNSCVGNGTTLPYTKVTIDQSSITNTSATPTITGTITGNAKGLRIELDQIHKPGEHGAIDSIQYRSGVQYYMATTSDVVLSGQDWSWTINKILPVGTYSVFVSNQDSYSLAHDTLTVSDPKPSLNLPPVPQITSITPTSGPPGTTVTINGSGFMDATKLYEGHDGGGIVPTVGNGATAYYTIPADFSGYCGTSGKDAADCFGRSLFPYELPIMVTNDGINYSNSVKFTITKN